MRNREHEEIPLNWQEEDRKTLLWFWAVGVPILVAGIWLLVDLGAERGRRFRDLPLGTPEDRVIELLGKPTEILRLPRDPTLICSPDEVEPWEPVRYLRWSGKGDHTTYAIGLNDAGRVIRKCDSKALSTADKELNRPIDPTD